MVNSQNEVKDVKNPTENEEMVETTPTASKESSEQENVAPTAPVEKQENKEVKEVSDKKVESDEDMMSLLDEHFSKFETGKIVEGTVVAVDEKSVLVDIGFKSESSIPIREFTSSNLPVFGTKIKVFIDSVEDGTGRLKLSKKKADFYDNLEKLVKLRDDNESISGILRRRVKGGMIVEIDNIEAFLPGSQISTKPIPNLDQFIGKEARFKILKIDEERRNVIVSRKKVIMEEQETKLVDLKKVLLEGAELDGEVRNITDYGAFIDLGGIDGLLHITDMSWGHINHPSDMLNIGDKVKVKVLQYDEENEKVSLGLKQLVPHPWENIETKYPEGTIVSGKVVNITNYGAFIEIESGVEGLVHISELSWTKKIKHPKQLLKVGDGIKAIVLATSKDDRRISLGVKQMEANPWLTIDERYPMGESITGKIKSITPFGVFVEIEEDIEGLVHISDISWTKRIYHPKEVFKRGDEITVKVLSIDKALHRIALGVKQLSLDPWSSLDERLPINTEVEASIAKIISKGVLVDVTTEKGTVEGFVPLSHLAIPGLKKADEVFKLEEVLPVKVIELDLENRRLILSVKAYYFGKNTNELQGYLLNHEVGHHDVQEAITEAGAVAEPVVVDEPILADEPVLAEEPVVEEVKEEVVAEVVAEPVVEEVVETPAAEEAPVEEAPVEETPVEAAPVEEVEEKKE